MTRNQYKMLLIAEKGDILLSDVPEDLKDAFDYLKFGNDNKIEEIPDGTHQKFKINQWGLTALAEYRKNRRVYAVTLISLLLSGIAAVASVLSLFK